MAKTKYYIHLSNDERSLLTKIACEGKESTRTIMRAKILLMSDATQPEKLSIKKLAERLGTTDTTIQTVRTEYATAGLQAAVYRKERVVTEKENHRKYKPYRRTISDEVVQQVKALASSPPPEGKKKWNNRLLSQIAIERGIVDYISDNTVRKILKGEEPYNE